MRTSRGAKAINELVARNSEQIKPEKNPSMDGQSISLDCPIPEFRGKSRLVIVPDGNS